MKFATRPFLSGFGSVLNIHPTEVKSLSKLRKTHFPAFCRFAPLADVDSRKVDAEAIREALAHMTRSSANLERYLKRYTGGIEVHPGRDQGEDRKSFDSKQTVKIKIHRAGNVPEESKVYTVFTDHVKGLADMLAIRRDWERTSGDLVAAKQSQSATTPPNE